MNLGGRLVIPYQRGPEYGPAYVSKIQLTSSAPVHVLEENRWPGWWCKMGLFDPSIKGDFLVCDLDTIIVGDISDLVRAGKTMMLRDFFFPQRPASGVMFLTEEDRAKVWEKWIADPDRWMREFSGIRGGGDGAFLARFMQPKHFVQDHFPGQVVSFKVDCRWGYPKGARMICYHGRPRPHTTGWAPDNAHRWVKQVPMSSLHAREQGRPMR